MSLISPDLPLIDLHRHLDGSVRLETILDLGIRHHLRLPSFELEGLRPYVQVSEPQPGILAFFAKFEWMRAVLVDYEACRRIAFENVEDARREGLDYIELRFSPWFMAETHHLDPAGVVEAVVDGVRAGQDSLGVRANLIGIISRTYGPEIGLRELDAILSHKDHIVGLDLAGDEGNFPGAMFVEHFARGRDAGLRITVHAGEAAGPESVWQAIRELGAVRIGHAVRAVEDPALMDYMAEHRIGVETNLTSNVQTSTVSDYRSHPLKWMMDHGLLATINTDDPGISAIDLRDELEIAAPKAGLTESQVHQVQRNALAIAFLPDAEKQAFEKG